MGCDWLREALAKARAGKETVGFTRKKLAEIAEREGKLNLVWAMGSPATKYTQPFEGPPAWFGAARFAWCGAFVRWCCKEAGLDIGITTPSGFGYTWALVEAWQKWAEERKFYFDNDGKFEPQAGDIVIFDWKQTDIDQVDSNWDSHIGVYLRRNGKYYECAEGNTSNQTAVKTRESVTIQGFIRIPDGYSFSGTTVRPTPEPVEPTPVNKAKFEQQVEEIFEREGGFSNIAEDAGGPTNLGITQATLSTFMGRPASITDVQNLTKATAKEIYRKYYWDPLKLDEVESYMVSYILFDQGVNRGIGAAARDVQFAVGVLVDGQIGPQTLKAINAMDERKLAISLIKTSQLKYVRIVKGNPSQMIFLEGWINRSQKLMDLLV